MSKLLIEEYSSWDKDIIVYSEDGVFQMKVDHDDVDHKEVEKRIKEIVRVYNASLNKK